MKIVQSLWTKPSLKKENLTASDRSKGGWEDKKYNYFSWALSCLQFRKFYDEIELVTDEMGYDLLIDKIGLPYTSVRVELDRLNKYHPDLWALGKIYAYSIQEQPFLHADGDVYIWEKLPGVESASLVAQNRETSFEFYNEIFLKIVENFEHVPDVLFESSDRNNNIVAVNAGVIGGNDINFVKSYAKQAFDMVNDNYDNLQHVNIGMSNIIFEQFLFYALAEAEGNPIHFITSNVNHAFDGLAELTGVPNRIKYVHPVGAYKRSKYIGELVGHHLLQSYPEYYYNILNLLRTSQI